MEDTFEIAQYDTGPPFKVRLTDDQGNARDVSGSTVTLHITEEDSDTILIQDSTNVSFITDGSDGEVKYDWQSGDTDEPGYYEARWKVEFIDGTIERFPNDSWMEVIIHTSRIQ